MLVKGSWLTIKNWLVVFVALLIVKQNLVLVYEAFKLLKFIICHDNKY